MSFKELVIEREYRSLARDIVTDFFIPVLKQSIEYSRAVGFFSSSALIEVSKGLIGLQKNSGRIRLICSPKLSEEDIEAMSRGYETRRQAVANAALRAFRDPFTKFEEERLNLLAHLVENGQLDIKLAFIEKNGSYAIYHEKMGILKDPENNVVCFSGSLNESVTAYYSNYETIDVFCSWKSDFEQGKITDKITAFENLWFNKETGVETIDFPDVCIERLMSYKRNEINLEVDVEEFGDCFKEEPEPKQRHALETPLPEIPLSIKLHDYQFNAINSWLQNNCIGIFDMATGTGKTFTALAALSELCKKSVHEGLAVVIVCPFIHLVNQWVEEMRVFNIITPIIAYSGSPDKHYKNRLKESVIDFNERAKNFFCFICTNASFITEAIQSEIQKLKGNSLLIVDEAHNFGSPKLQETLGNHFKFRLALSATLERHRDEMGTQKLIDYFGKKCITYTLEQAIDEKKLSSYYYHPIITNLTDIELEKYNELSQKIKKLISHDENGQQHLSEQAKLLLIKRARIVAGAANKIPALIEAITNCRYDSHILVYCGATNVIDDTYIDNNEAINQDERQIDAVIQSLYSELEMKVARFTSRESLDERQLILSSFEEGDNIQALAAIKCLDEGVNIPKIHKAFILASTTNPKEYIQRRGRVLRLAEKKRHAEIYDFITLPRPINSVASLTEEIISNDFALIRNEIQRIQEFKRLSLNPDSGDKIISLLNEVYHLAER